MAREIIIFSPGKTKEKYLKEGIVKYQKLLQGFSKLELFFPEIKTSSLKEEEWKKKEASYFFNWMSKNKVGSLIVLDEKGKEFSSQEFSFFLEKELSQSYYPLLFYIGGPFGIDREIKRRAKVKIALSKMTFLHEMARLILLEQLYRAFQILKGTKYHK